jgi:hypothetical protein
LPGAINRKVRRIHQLGVPGQRLNRQAEQTEQTITHELAYQPLARLLRFRRCFYRRLAQLLLQFCCWNISGPFASFRLPQFLVQAVGPFDHLTAVLKIPFLQLVTDRFVITQQATIQVMHAERDLGLALHLCFELEDMATPSFDDTGHFRVDIELSRLAQHGHSFLPGDDVFDMMLGNPGVKLGQVRDDLLWCQPFLQVGSNFILELLVIEVLGDLDGDEFHETLLGVKKNKASTLGQLSHHCLITRSHKCGFPAEKRLF